MQSSLLFTVAVCLLSVTAYSTKTHAQTSLTTMETNNPSNSKAAVQEFFNAFGQGNMQGILDSFHDQCKIVAVRDAARKGDEVYGTYTGKEGVHAFIANLGNAFETQAFGVDQLIAEGSIVFASGTFTHRIKATGKLFSSAWALRCLVEGGLIREYHFYEDSGAFASANK